MRDAFIWASGVYDWVQAHPIVPWAIGLVVLFWKRVLSFLRRPWDLVSLPDASAHILGKIEPTVMAVWARHAAGGPEDVLTFLAHYFAHNVTLEATRPPATLSRPIPAAEYAKGGFRNKGESFHYYGNNAPAYADVSVRRWRMWCTVWILRWQSWDFKRSYGKH